MLKNFKRGLILTSAFLFSVLAPAVAAPQNMELKTESTINSNGQRIIVNSHVYYGNKKIRMENELSENKNIPAGMGKSTIIYDSAEKVVYMMVPQNKTVIKADSDTLSKIQSSSGGGANINTQLLSDPAQIPDQLKKQGGKMVGAETVLGYLCDIWQLKSEIPMMQPGQPAQKEPADVKVWLAHKLSIPLKVEITTPKRGKIVQIQAKEVKTGVSIPNSLFEIPAGYQVTDVQKMMNQMKKQVPANTKK